jgi:hypothetical protein
MTDMRTPCFLPPWLCRAVHSHALLVKYIPKTCSEQTQYGRRCQSLAKRGLSLHTARPGCIVSGGEH